MARAEDQELVDRFQQFFRRYYGDAVGELAQRFPDDQKSLHVDWLDIFQFDPDLAEDVIAQPGQIREYAEEALRLYDLPADVSLAGAHVRIRDLDQVTDIRNIRSDHVNTLVSVQGLIRKATDVRPRITEAAFECQRCGTLNVIPQTRGGFQEPHECQGCERQGPFEVNFDQSEFVDAQKLRVQESPEGLRGGETPQSIDVTVEDDITGEVTPGDHVTVTGVLRLDQQERGGEKTAMFDVRMDGWSIEIEDEEFEDMEITDQDKADIVDLSNQSDIYETMVDSVAPSIYGYREEKLAMILQLFSGVTKELPDGSRIRGDLHMLLIGDPGTGKCLKGDSKVTLADGRETRIDELVEANLDTPTPVDDGVYDEAEIDLPSMSTDGSMDTCCATRVWKRDAPDQMYRIRTAEGHEIEVTPSHPLFVLTGFQPEPTQAEALSEGAFIAAPRRIPSNANDEIDIDHRRSQANNAVRLDSPDEWTPSHARLLGYIVAEGYVSLNEDNTGMVSITNEDREVLDDITSAFEDLGLPYTERDAEPGEKAKCIACTASEFVSFLSELEPAILEISKEQRVPESLFSASLEIQRAFLKAYIEGEGHVSDSQRELAVVSMSHELLEGVQSLLGSQGINSSLSERANGSYRLRISGADFEQYIRDIGFVTERKSQSAAQYADVRGNTNTDVVPINGDRLRELRERLALSQFDFEIPRTTYQHYERGDRNPSRERLGKVVDAFERRLSTLRSLLRRVEQNDWEDVENLRKILKVSQQSLANQTDVTQTAISYYERESVVPDGGIVQSAQDLLEDRIQDGLAVEPMVQRLRALSENDIRWSRIVSVEPVEPNYDSVYDLEVEGTHTYVSNGLISHNSQLLQYIRQIAPRSVYTSGKGSSAAGLTAAAVRDDFGDGQQWTLEAGALVLADKGIAAVDELDKMDAGDRSALHEALEQQTISISKAGINATLKARCSLLGAANPKYGRFDQYEPIGEQIDLEPALVSRFDLIFTVSDQPDESEDRELAEHILQTNYAGELSTQRRELTAANVTESEVSAEVETVAPEIDAELLRKYIAHAKSSVYPTLSDEARERIRDFYVDLRSQGADEDAPVPVTARKLEALVRLSEASARVRLSDTVTEKDAERVIEIVRSCLKDIGVDPETGEFDADVIEVGQSKTQRDRAKNIRSIVAEIETEYEDGAPVEEVLDRAEEAGHERSKAEHELDKLKQKGEVYQPSQGHLRTT